MYYIFSRQAFPTINECKEWLRERGHGGYYKVYSDEINWYLELQDTEKELLTALNNILI